MATPTPYKDPKTQAARALRDAIRRCSHHAPRFDILDGPERLRPLLDAVDPAWLFTARAGGKASPCLLEEAFATGDEVLVEMAVEHALHAHSTTRAHSLFPFPFHAWCGDRLATGTGLWERAFAGQGTLSQSVWLLQLDAAAKAQRPDVIAWIAAQPGLWRDGPSHTLDVLERLTRLRCPPHTSTHDALLACARTAWDRHATLCAQEPDTPHHDPRHRMQANIWAMGCLRLGWRSPTHSRAHPFSDIVAATGSAHGALAFHRRMGRWEDWIGMGQAEGHTFLMELVAQGAP